MKIVGIQKSQLIILLVLSIAAVVLNYFGDSSFSDQLYRLGVIAVSFYCVAIFIFAQAGVNDAASKLFFSFFFVFGLFHLGVPLGAVIGEFGEDLASYIDLWYYTETTYNALIAVFVFMVGYTIAFLVSPRFKRTEISDVFSIKPIHFKAGFYILSILVLLWILIVKLIFQVGTYSEYYEFAENPWLRFVYTYFNGLIGFLFVLLCLSEDYRRKAVYWFFFWAIFAFPMGLRGGVLFPLAIALPILIKNKVIKATFFRASAGVVILLILISLVFHYRSEGQLTEGAVISPVGAVVEMGGSLRPVYESFKWISTGESNFLVGQTYWAPFERTASKVVPFLNVPDAFEDDRLMNVVIVRRAGAYGFSIAAEAYINFGFIGVLIIGFGSGLLLLRLDSRLLSLPVLKYSFVDLCFAAAIFFHIRQSFVGAYGTFMVGFALCISLSVVYALMVNKSWRLNK